MVQRCVWASQDDAALACQNDEVWALAWDHLNGEAQALVYQNGEEREVLVWGHWSDEALALDRQNDGAQALVYQNGEVQEEQAWVR